MSHGRHGLLLALTAGQHKKRPGRSKGGGRGEAHIGSTGQKMDAKTRAILKTLVRAALGRQDHAELLAALEQLEAEEDDGSVEHGAAGGRRRSEDD